ncbi:MAG: hypothetical protein ACLUZX_11955 [Subdoligranulum sp.]
MTIILLLVHWHQAIRFSIKKVVKKIAIYNQTAGKIEDDEIYDDFIAFLKDLYDLLGIGE